MLVSCGKQQGLIGERIYKEVQINNWVNDKERYNKLKTKAEEAERKREELRRLEEERIRKEIEEQKKKAWENSGFSHVVEYTLRVSYYTNYNSKLEGGHYDRRGKLLTSHNEPIVAMNSSIPYGSYLITDEPVNGNTKFKVIDCGGAMGINNGIANVDVFIPNKTSDWLAKNTQKQVVTGKVYYKR